MSPRVPLGDGPWSADDPACSPPWSLLDRIPAADFGALTLPLFPGFSPSALATGGVVDTIKMRNSGGAEMAFTLYAAPRSAGMRPAFTEASRRHILSAGATPQSLDGNWGEEIVGDMPDGHRVHFIAASGPCWLLRASARSLGARRHVDALLLRKALSYALVRRGGEAQPAGSAIALTASPRWGTLGGFAAELRRGDLVAVR